MGRFSQKIQAVMTGEAVAGPMLDFFLRALSLIYALGVRVRNFLYDQGMLPSKSLPCRVISIGNLTLGGTGKTPMTVWLANLLKDAGFRPVVISRGYQGRAERTGGIVSDGERILAGPDIAGDEPFLMAETLKGVPVLVGADRFRSGITAHEKFSPDVILLDDGFQHRRLKRDLDIVLVDAGSFFGNGRLLPRGVLREPVSAISRADLLILTRCEKSAGQAARKLALAAPGKPVFQSAHAPYVSGLATGGASAGVLAGGMPGLSDLKKFRVFAFSGIAKNKEFLRTVEKFAGSVAGMMTFDDHHCYTDADFQKIGHQARQCGADCLVTTEKDYVKIAGRFQTPMNTVVVGIRIRFVPDDRAVSEWIMEKMRQKGGSG